MSWVVISTWGFSLKGIEYASSILANNGCVFDAIEETAKIAEDDPEVDTVGFGGIPNAVGEVELDAAFMNGKDLAIGAVAGLKGFRHPVSVARKVMTHLPHNLLVGQGAEDFAAKNGFERKIMLTEAAIRTWQSKNDGIQNGMKEHYGHDTIGVVGMGLNGDMACCTSSSGAAVKHRGRVGDSPLVGSGFYIDNEVGGAAATGLGEDIMKCCTCFHAVELMRQGYLPQRAAEEAVRRTHMRLAKYRNDVGNIAVVCADNKGNFGAAANHEGFEYAAASDSAGPCIYQVKSVKFNR